MKSEDTRPKEELLSEATNSSETKGRDAQGPSSGSHTYLQKQQRHQRLDAKEVIKGGMNGIGADECPIMRSITIHVLSR